MSILLCIHQNRTPRTVPFGLWVLGNCLNDWKQWNITNHGVWRPNFIFIRDYIDPGPLEWDHFESRELNYCNTWGTQISSSVSSILEKGSNAVRRDVSSPVPPPPRSLQAAIIAYFSVSHSIALCSLERDCLSHLCMPPSVQQIWLNERINGHVTSQFTVWAWVFSFLK